MSSTIFAYIPNESLNFKIGVYCYKCYKMVSIEIVLSLITIPRQKNVIYMMRSWEWWFVSIQQSININSFFT